MIFLFRIFYLQVDLKKRKQKTKNKKIKSRNKQTNKQTNTKHTNPLKRGNSRRE